MSELEDSLRKIIREEIERVMPQRDYRGYPVTPLPALPSTSNRCLVCGIDFGYGPMGYACGNPMCPTAVRAQ